jgi:hypothetical protein
MGRLGALKKYFKYFPNSKLKHEIQFSYYNQYGQTGIQVKKYVPRTTAGLRCLFSGL